MAFTWGYWGAVCWMAKAAAGVSRSSRLRRKLGDPAQREGQRLLARLIQPLHVVDRDQYRAAGDAGAQRGEHRQADRVRGGRLLPGGPQQQGNLQRLPLRGGDLAGHLRQ